MPVTAQASIASHSLLGLAQAAKQVFGTHISATVDFSGGEERQALHSESRPVISRVVWVVGGCCFLQIAGRCLDCGVRARDFALLTRAIAANCRRVAKCGLL